MTYWYCSITGNILILRIPIPIGSQNHTYLIHSTHDMSRNTQDHNSWAVCMPEVSHSFSPDFSIFKTEMLRVDSEPFLTWLSMTGFHSFPGGQLWTTSAWPMGKTLPWLETLGCMYFSPERKGRERKSWRGMRGEQGIKQERERRRHHSVHSSVKEIFIFISLTQNKKWSYEIIAPQISWSLFSKHAFKYLCKVYFSSTLNFSQWQLLVTASQAPLRTKRIYLRHIWQDWASPPAPKSWEEPAKVLSTSINPHLLYLYTDQPGVVA